MTRWRKITYWLGFATGLVLLLAQIWSAASSMRAGQVSYERTVLIFAVFLIYLVIQILQVISWWLIMTGLGARLPLNHSLLGYFPSSLPRYIPGTIWGYLSRSDWLYRQYGVIYRTSLVGSGLEIVVAVCSGVSLVGMIGAVGTSGEVGGFHFLISMLIPSTIWAILRLAGRISAKHAKLSGAGLPLLAVLPLRSWLASVAVFSLQWILYGVALYGLTGIIIQEFPKSVQILTTLSPAFVYSWIAGLAIVFLPSGLGVRELLLSNQLVSTLGIGGGAASTIAVGSRLALGITEILLVVCALLILHRSNYGPSGIAKSTTNGLLKKYDENVKYTQDDISP